MLDSLEIQNYRNFKHLRIEKLGRVNLIIGKNNTGKTSLLEAVSLYVSNDRIKVLKEIFKLRGELDEEHYEDLNTHKIFNENITLLKSIFHGRKLEESTKIIIRAREESDLELSLEYRNNQPHKYFLGKETGKWVKCPITHLLTDYILFLDSPECFFYVPAQCTYTKDNTENWGRIALTEGEKIVIQALNIIDKSIERFTYILENEEQKPKVSTTSGEVLHLRSMGDGINRILTIILSMVNCKDGYLLIDEFDNGLHVSVQKQLWEIVFYLANKLNIQVFATTHSHDCIDAFGYVLGSGKYAESDGIMVRLDNWEGNIDATIYEADDIFNTIRAETDPR